MRMARKSGTILAEILKISNKQMDEADMDYFSTLPPDSIYDVLESLGMEGILDLYKSNHRKWEGYLNSSRFLHSTAIKYQLPGAYHSFQELLKDYDIFTGSGKCTQYADPIDCAKAAIVADNVRGLIKALGIADQQPFVVKTTVSTRSRTLRNLRSLAAQYDRTELLKILSESPFTGGTGKVSKRTVLGYSIGGHFNRISDDMLKERRIRTAALKGAAYGGYIDYIDELIKKYPIDQRQLVEAQASAAEGGQIATLQHLIKLAGTEDLMKIGIGAAKGGNVALLHHVLKQTGNFNEKMMSEAVKADQVIAVTAISAYPGVGGILFNYKRMKGEDLINITKWLISCDSVPMEQLLGIYAQVRPKYGRPAALSLRYLLSLQPSQELLDRALVLAASFGVYANVKLLTDYGATSFQEALANTTNKAKISEEERAVKDFLIGMGAVPVLRPPDYDRTVDSSVNRRYYEDYLRQYYQSDQYGDYLRQIYPPQEYHRPVQYTSGPPDQPYIPTYPGQSYRGGYYPIQR